MHFHDAMHTAAELREIRMVPRIIHHIHLKSATVAGQCDIFDNTSIQDNQAHVQATMNKKST